MNLPECDHLAPDRDRQFISLGHFCGMFQILPSQLRGLMEDCGVSFSEVRDGIGYLTIPDAEKVGTKCRDILREISEVSQSAESN